MDGETHDGFGKKVTMIQCDNQGAARLGLYRSLEEYILGVFLLVFFILIHQVFGCT
jgi:hypothetical protein